MELPGCIPKRKLVALLETSLTVLLVLFVICALAQPAYAYVDPGSGFVTCQAISTIFFGIIFFLRRRLRMLFKRKTDNFRRLDARDF